MVGTRSGARKGSGGDAAPPAGAATPATSRRRRAAAAPQQQDEPEEQHGAVAAAEEAEEARVEAVTPAKTPATGKRGARSRPQQQHQPDAAAPPTPQQQQQQLHQEQQQQHLSKNEMLEQLVQKWLPPADPSARMRLFLRTTLFQTDFIFGAYFLEWWETGILYVSYLTLLGLVLYSVARQGAHLLDLVEPWTNEAAARLSSLSSSFF